MSGIDRNDFNERLRRIEAERRGTATPPPGARPTADPVIRSTPRGAGPGLRLALVFVVLGALGVGGLIAAPQIKPLLEGLQIPLPTPQKTAAAGTQARRSAAKTEPGALMRAAFNTFGPVAAVQSTDRMGLIVGDDHAVGPDLTVTPLSAITTDPRPTGPETPVAGITPFAPNEGCGLRPIGPGERLINVNLYSATHEAPVQVLNRAQMVEDLAKGLKDTLLKDKPVEDLWLDHGLTGAVDVYLTDTSAPLYLALQSPARNRLWVLHAAPGVRVAHVALIGQGASAVAGDLGTASVEAIRADEFGFASDSFLSRAPELEWLKCMALPFQKPDESWGAWVPAQKGNMLDGNLLYGQGNGYTAYADWFTKTLGQGPDVNLIRAAGAGAVLVGPVPPAPFAPADAAAGLTIRLAGADLALSGDPATRAAAVEASYRDILTRAAGGDLAQVIPPERVFDQPAPPAPLLTPSKTGLAGRMLGIDGFTRDPNLRMLDMTETSDARRIGVRGAMAFADLLAPGEADPPAAERLLYAMLRVPRLTEHFCEDTVAEIATRCRIAKYSVWVEVPRKSASGKAATEDPQLRYDVTFGYAPNYPITDREIDPGASQHAFVSAFLPDTNLAHRYDTPEARRAYLRHLRAMCDVLRPEYGSCLIEVAGFDLHSPATFTDGQKSNAAGWLSVFAADNPFVQQQVEARIEALAAEMAP